MGLWLAAPSATAWAAEPVRFSITCDNRDFPGFADVLQQMKKAPGAPGQFMISPGDVNPPEDTRATLSKVFGETFPWYPAVGNHEIGHSSVTTSKNAPQPKAAKGSKQGGRAPDASMKYLREYFDKNLKGKVNPGPKGTQETTYSFDAGPVHVAVINLYWNGQPDPGSDAKGKGEPVPALWEWMKSDLAASQKPWKLVVGHVPAFPQPDRNWSTARHADEAWDATKCDAFWKVLEDAGVAAYICGHTHRYSRYRPEGSKVWQIDSAQARGGTEWKYDAFVIVTADDKSLKFDVYRNLDEKSKFAVTDSLTIGPGRTVAAETAAPVPRPEPAGAAK
jgi:hypothetical protein